MSTSKFAESAERYLLRAPWVGTDNRGAVRLVQALYDTSGADAYWAPDCDIALEARAEERAEAVTVCAPTVTPAHVADREIQAFRSMVNL